ncbi:MAG: LysR family transcriptional regulator [Myxococcales bacterium]|nr:LysR family transcriptional regulator [Myxococcales bacterium]
MSDINLNKIRQLDGSLLLVLRELLRQRRTTLVAERLGLSQSAVSHALSRLRVLFDDELFIRRPHGLEPTRHALELSPRVDGLLESMAGALGLATSFDPQTTTRSFRIAAPDHLATLIAAPLLSDLTKSAPHSRFSFSQRLGDDALQALGRDEIDIALGRFGSPDPGLSVERVLDDRYCLVARRRHPRLRDGLTKALFVELDHVLVSVSGEFLSPEGEAPAGRMPERRTVAAVPRFLIAFAVVGRTNAVSVAPHGLASAYASSFGLALHELPFRLAPIRVLAIRRKQADPGTLWLLERIKHAVAPSAGALRT